MIAEEIVFPQPTEIAHTVAVLAKDQPEYSPLPCAIVHDPRIPVITRWRFTAQELEDVLNGGDVILQMLTFGKGYSPVALTVVAQDANPVVVE